MLFPLCIIGVLCSAARLIHAYLLCLDLRHPQLKIWSKKPRFSWFVVSPRICTCPVPPILTQAHMTSSPNTFSCKLCGLCTLISLLKHSYQGFATWLFLLYETLLSSPPSDICWNDASVRAYLKLYPIPCLPYPFLLCFSL